MRAPSLLLLLLSACGNPDAPAHAPLDLATPSPVRDMADPLDLATADAAHDLKSLRIRRVFVSSQLFGANLGGLAGADVKCQRLANTIPLGGQWKAWLSDADGSPSTRFSRDGVFALVSGNPVADSWEQLTSGGLRHAIDFTETGDPIFDAGGSDVPVWTDTATDGRLDDIRWDCGDFSDVLAAQSAIGLSTAQGTSWTHWSQANRCDLSAALYCFEQ